MPFEIVLSPEALRDLRRLRADLRATIQVALVRYLRHTPTRVSRSRIKRLRRIIQPMYRLRVGDIRVYYDVVENRVEVVAIMEKSQSTRWLQDLERR